MGIVRLTALLLLLTVSSCAAPAAAPQAKLRDFRGIIHCHSKYSHDSKGTYEEILAAAKTAKVDFIIMTDHPPKGDHGLSIREGWKGIHDGVLFIQGAEYGDKLLALGLKEPLTTHTPQEKIKEIHAQGALAFVCHPEEVTDWDQYLEADGMEIYNVHAALKRKRDTDPQFLAKVVKALKEDPENSYSLLQELDQSVLKKWDEMNQKRRFVGIAGNDSHQNVNFFGLQLDPYPRAFKFVSTHVAASELTEQAILKALKEGKCWVAFDRVHPSTPLSPTAEQPGEKDCVTVVYKDWKYLGEFPGAEAIGYSGPWRGEWWITKPNGRVPWILFNWNLPGPRRP